MLLGSETEKTFLARISHKVSTAATDLGMSTALRSVGLLDILSSMPAELSVARRLAKRRIHAHLRRLGRFAYTKPCEKCGLEFHFLTGYIPGNN